MARWLRRKEWLALVVALAALPATARAAVITVTTTQPGVNTDAFCSLQEAIYSANFDSKTFVDPGKLLQGPITVGCDPGSGEDVIVLAPGAVYTVPAVASSIVADPFNYMGPTATPIIFSTITIEGNGARFERPNANRDFSGVLFRAFAVGGVEPIAPSQGGVTGKGGWGALTLRNLHVRGFEVKGGNGADGGGGGMGAGGAIYANFADLTIQNCTFENNGALGGNGATTGARGTGPGGGGGGLGGNGGFAAVHTATVALNNSGSGGGGGGARGNGGVNGGDQDQYWVSYAGGAGGGTLSDGESGFSVADGGYRCGGAGGLRDEDGHDATCNGGGGGGGGIPDAVTGAFKGDGGWGGYGGGGGGGGFYFGFNDFSSHGGRGGFGGGGGAGSENDYGGSSLYGGGGGAGTTPPGVGGRFGGDASDHHGGGGAALGGAIFADRSFLVIENSTFVGNYVLRGSAPAPTPDLPDVAQNGSNRGGALFAYGGQTTIRHSTFSANEAAGQNPAIHVDRWTDPDAIVPQTRLFLYNTIIGGNIPAINECQVGANVSVQGAGNLIGGNDGCPGVVSSNDPRLGPLQLHAPGLTPTMAIGLDSPAYDKADAAESLPLDQRGVTRPQSIGYDIGAYEVIKPSADLAISKTTVGQPMAGTYFSWAIDVINFGPTAAKSVSVVDTLPAGVVMSSAGGSGGFTCQWTNAQVTCTNPDMGAGGTAALTITVLIPPGFAGASIANTVTVSSTTPDPVASNNTASVSANVRKDADLRVATSGPPLWVAGADATYNVVVTNNGPSNAIDVALGDLFPAGTTFVAVGQAASNGWACTTPPVGAGAGMSCTRAGALAAGASASLTLTLRTAPSVAAGTLLCNQAGATANNLDPNLTDNSATGCSAVQTVADLALVQPAVTTSGSPGKGTATFTFTTTNRGPSDSQGVQLLARSSGFTGAQPAISVSSAGSCSVAGSDITCTWASVPLNGTASVVVTIPWRSAQGDVCAAGSVSAGTSDPNAANNAASSCVTKKK